MTLRLQLKQRQLTELSAEYEHKASTTLRKIIPGDTSRRRLELSRALARGGQLMGSMQNTLIQLHAMSEKLEKDNCSLRQLTDTLLEAPGSGGRGKEDGVVLRYQRQAAQLLTEAQPELELALQQVQQDILSLSCASLPPAPRDVTPARDSPEQPTGARRSTYASPDNPEVPPGAPPGYSSLHTESGSDVVLSVQRLGLYPQIEASSKDSQSSI